MSTFMNNRLKQFLAAENITQAQFADTINVVRASVSHILSGRNKPSYDFIKTMMLNYPKLNIEWLMFGKGKMYKDSRNNEAEVLFPEESPLPETVPALEFPELFHDESENYAGVPVSNEIDTLNETMQGTVKQRKVSRIIVLFDDGSYQEL